ncbi:hypothetical protein [uncultured Selenomonas sp.]|uniref:hypothetical protein n=1 Tax=uncultured Selenomonas sp. TaxID=159275 RepID=UPI0025E2E011|nr:hypothetical protein [uncultured Selenomonas sp.]
MDFGIRGTSNYDLFGASPYGWGKTNGTEDATNGNPIATQNGDDDAQNPLAPKADNVHDKNSATDDVRQKDDDELTPEEKRAKASGHKSTPEECETCKRRKYQDGSDEMVSFKAVGHIDPGNAASVVMSHEQEHVSNAYQKAKDNNGEVVRASVRLKTAVCPECGRTYISGGETTTQIRYYNEDNPYQQDMKESDADNKYRGANVDIPA